jgi:hypothetical protein
LFFLGQTALFCIKKHKKIKVNVLNFLKFLFSGLYCIGFGGENLRIFKDFLIIWAKLRTFKALRNNLKIRDI